jgi:RND family efflux transporter MFP subunit
VIERNISVGEKITKGQILIQLDPREYEIAVQKAKGKVESAKAQVNFASRDYERMKKLYERDAGAISASLLDLKLEKRNELKAELTIAENDFEKAEDDLSYTSLKSPYDGVIAAIYVENHEQVRAKQPAVRLIDSDEREMDINVPERYVNSIIEGSGSLKFIVRLDAFPDKVFSADIKEIGPEASSTTQTYPVTLTLKDISMEPALLPGMSGRAILLQKGGARYPAKAYPVPHSAIFSDDLNSTLVWVVDPKTETVHKQPVRLDKESKGDFALIQEGITAGDWVVTAGTSYLSEGQKVKMVSEKARP